MRKYTVLILLFCLNLFNSQKILFDNTKAEMIENADWIIDSDGGELHKKIQLRHKAISLLQRLKLIRKVR
ncbi:hypothetical protein SAMN05421876_105183 [Kaistella jeonii]|nr:hypothetical protein SAMN05421876_105183 [Kaistella jeonii]VEI96713.1 Uncharacterised protein [Kaistella jeonii]